MICIRRHQKTEDIEDEGVITVEKEDVDIVSQLEEKLDDLIEPLSPITEQQYIEFQKALILKNIEPNIPKIAKESNLSEDKTARILMSLPELRQKSFQMLKKESRNKKLEAIFQKNQLLKENFGKSNLLIFLAISQKNQVYV